MISPARTRYPLVDSHIPIILTCFSGTANSIKTANCMRNERLQTRETSSQTKETGPISQSCCSARRRSFGAPRPRLKNQRKTTETELKSMYVHPWWERDGWKSSNHERKQPQEQYTKFRSPGNYHIRIHQIETHLITSWGSSNLFLAYLQRKRMNM